MYESGLHNMGPACTLPTPGISRLPWQTPALSRVGSPNLLSFPLPFSFSPTHMFTFQIILNVTKSSFFVELCIQGQEHAKLHPYPVSYTNFKMLGIYTLSKISQCLVLDSSSSGLNFVNVILNISIIIISIHYQ